MMEASVKQHKIGIASSPKNPALILFYTRGTSGLRKRVMPVRGLLEQGAEPAARRLITAHAQYLEELDLEQVIALCKRLHAKLSVSCSPAAPEKSENAPPQTSCTPKELDRSLLHDIAMDMSPDEAPAPSAAARALAANDDALAAFAGGGLSSRSAAQLLRIGDEPSPSASRAADAGRGAGGATSIAATGDKGDKGGKAKGATPKKAKKGRGGRADPAAELARYGRSLLETEEERGPSLESLLGMSSEDEATPRQRGGGGVGGGGGGSGMSSLAGIPQLGSARAAPGMSSLAGMPALF